MFAARVPTFNRTKQRNGLGLPGRADEVLNVLERIRGPQIADRASLVVQVLEPGEDAETGLEICCNPCFYHISP